MSGKPEGSKGMASGPPSDNTTAPGPASGGSTQRGGGGVVGTGRSRSAEFKKRIHQFEGAGSEEDLFETSLVEQSARARK